MAGYFFPPPVLVLVFVVYNRRREAQIKYPNPDDDVRENIINYEDEGGGEDDMTAFDITPLQIPVADPALLAAAGHHHTLTRTKMPCKGGAFTIYLFAKTWDLGRAFITITMACMYYVQTTRPSLPPVA